MPPIRELARQCSIYDVRQVKGKKKFWLFLNWLNFDSLIKIVDYTFLRGKLLFCSEYLNKILCHKNNIKYIYRRLKEFKERKNLQHNKSTKKFYFPLIRGLEFLNILGLFWRVRGVETSSQTHSISFSITEAKYPTPSSVKEERFNFTCGRDVSV